jgi:hypothetical protein
MPATDDGRPVGSGVPECGTGPVGRLRFVVSELRDVWRELHAHVHRESRSGGTTPHDDGPDSGKQGSV